MPGVTSPNKKHSLVISSWVEREEPSWGSTWRSGRHAQSGHTDQHANRNMMKPPSNRWSRFCSACSWACHPATSLVEWEMHASTGQHSPSCPDYECADSGFPVRGGGSRRRLCEVVSLPAHTPARCPRLGDSLWISMSFVPTLEQKGGVPWFCLHCRLTQAMCCIHLSLFKAPWYFDLRSAVPLKSPLWPE